MVKVIDEVAAAADVSAKRADSLRERAYLNIDAAMAVEVIDGTASIATENAGSVRIIDHHDGSVFIGKVAELVDGADIADGEDNVPTVPRCVVNTKAEENAGCGPPPEPTDCKEHKIEALVEDVAEVDIESAQPGVAPVREAVWVDYFADGGSFKGAKKLVSDTTTGYREDHATTWTAPAEAGLVSIWAVAHDGRGGSSVTRRFLRVE